MHTGGGDYADAGGGDEASHDEADAGGDKDTSGDQDAGVQVKQAALLILGLKEKFKLTQVAIQGIINGVTGLVQVGTTKPVLQCILC